MVSVAECKELVTTPQVLAKLLPTGKESAGLGQSGQITLQKILVLNLAQHTVSTLLDSVLSICCRDPAAKDPSICALPPVRQDSRHRDQEAIRVAAANHLQLKTESQL